MDGAARILLLASSHRYGAGVCGIFKLFALCPLPSSPKAKTSADLSATGGQIQRLRIAAKTTRQRPPKLGVLSLFGSHTPNACPKSCTDSTNSVQFCTKSIFDRINSLPGNGKNDERDSSFLGIMEIFFRDLSFPVPLWNHGRK